MGLSILVINPNSSKKVTDNFAQILEKPDGVSFDFYTAPEAAPAEITGSETSIASEKVVLPDLKEKGLIDGYDGFLVCCYSDHPLIHSLAKLTKGHVMGIMQATLLYALLDPLITKLVIITSVSEWEPLLDKGITDFVGASSFPINKFQRTKALNTSVLSLSDPAEFEKIRAVVDSHLNGTYRDDKIDCVLLGCAGMAGLDDQLSRHFPGVKFIDSVKIGVDLLTALVRFKRYQA